MKVRPAMPGSYEAMFHETAIPAFLMVLPRGSHVTDALREPMLERAIGVIYRPETEFASHYFHAHLSDQFDAIIHFDETRAVEPLEQVPELTGALPGEPAETFPSGE
jgi:erythromycin esterase-like protein